ncbi:hypothetical protein PHSY_005409 [Pseudozyma hubeiensis SY62]|uniref:Uncharacterized protein n=1 Tax=Pseudozyma hubeiensis (strain SY62) TaxID=1305764 RepID=R9P900_PSEHS|nr:hypothetical protein PHSY_005409 [Pseudozyma hubeiensis SY62]GAC97821.1 hypothetical protein PHSY_005409 [Pseudozyma hubeiensis SY62]
MDVHFVRRNRVTGRHEPNVTDGILMQTRAGRAERKTRRAGQRAVQLPVSTRRSEGPLRGLFKNAERRTVGERRARRQEHKMAVRVDDDITS